MKKRTKIELVVFAIVAVLFVLGLIRDMPSSPAPVPESTAAAAIELPAVPDISETETTESPLTSAIETIQHSGEGESGSQDPLPSESAAVLASAPASEKIAEDGEYTDKDSVALYIHTYGHLPSNYITKDEARDAGGDSQKGNLSEVCPGKSIGGDRFGNYEGLLPKKKGRSYTECDIDYNPKKGSRGRKRIVFSNDGLVYYTEDHYESFELLYGEP